MSGAALNDQGPAYHGAVAPAGAGSGPKSRGRGAIRIGYLNQNTNFNQDDKYPNEELHWLAAVVTQPKILYDLAADLYIQTWNRAVEFYR